MCHRKSPFRVGGLVASPRGCEWARQLTRSATPGDLTRIYFDLRRISGRFRARCSKCGRLHDYVATVADMNKTHQPPPSGEVIRL